MMKTSSSRREIALRRVGCAIILLYLVNSIFLIGLPLPIQAVRHNEERMGTGQTAVVCRDWAPEWSWRFLTYLTESENVTLLSGANLTLLGWMDGFGVALDCSKPAPLYAGYWEIFNASSEKILYVFGRVDDAAIDRLELEYRYDGTADREKAVQQIPKISSSRAEWMEQDGRTYFLICFDNDEAGRVLPEIAGYDVAGQELVCLSIETSTSTYYH